MKKLFILLSVVVLAIGFIGCKKKDDTNPSDTPQDNEVSINVPTTNLELFVDDTYTIQATITNYEAIGINEWTASIASGSDVVSISDNTITALKAGNATIQVAVKGNDGISTVMNITVVERPSVSFDLPASLKVGETHQINVDATGVTGTPQFISDNPDIASVDGNGLVSALKAGETVIRVKYNETTVSKSLVVEALPTGTIELSGESIVFIGYTITLKALRDGITGANTYTSSDTSIATVTSGGIVKGIKEGKVTITVTCSGVSASKEIQVKKAPTIEITNEVEWLPAGTTYQLELDLVDVEIKDLTFKSSDNKVATISDTGLITAIKEGSVRINVNYGVISKRMIIDIHEPQITIGNPESTVYVDDIYDMQVSVKYDNGNPVTYSSSDESIATVANGVVTLLDEGKVKITITCGMTVKVVELDVRSAQPKVVYDFNGGYSDELLISAVTDQATLALNNYNYVNGNFWNRYSTDIFISDRDHNPGATFSDRIYIAKNAESGLYEVVEIERSGASSWPDGGEYVICISNSYDTNGHGYYPYIKPIVSKFADSPNVYVAFGEDFTKASENHEVNVYFFTELPEKSTLNVLIDESTTLITPSRLGFTFLGWYDKNGNKVTEITDRTRSLKIQAKWEEKNPVTAIDVSSICDEILDQETFQVVAKVVPNDAYFQQLFYSTSNRTIFEVSSTGLITAINPGTATLTIHDYLNKVVYTKDITVNPKPTIVVNFNEVYKGRLAVGETINVVPKAVGKGLAQSFTYSSSNESVATVSADGLITALKNGETTITISIPDADVNITFLVQVKEYDDSTELGKLMKLLVDNHFGVVDYGNVSLYNDGLERYYRPTYGSVNNYLFDAFVIHRDYEGDAVNIGTCHTTRRSTDQIEFVCVHDTATLTGTVVNIASGMARNTGNGASIHYTVGNDAIYSVVPETLIAWHAGDGTGTVFNWFDSGVACTDPLAQPEYDMVKVDNQWYLTINGETSKIVLPTGSIANPSKTYLTHLGPTFKVQDGRYYIGTTWWSKDYGRISSHGGNNNSIGIEMNVNISNDIYDTWQRTAQLVADILLRYDLNPTRVKMHNTFSGKNCPQCLISADYWWEFMKMVNLQYTIQKDYPTAEISIVSNNPDILDNTGRIYNPPLTTTTVSYDLTVKLNGNTDTVRLYSIVNGSTTWEQWEGTYPATQIWNNGYYSLANK